MKRKPWERLDDESTVAFEAFATYRDLGVNRSTAAVGRAVGKNKKLMDRWSSAHSWVSRAAAYDAELDAVKTATTRDIVADMAERHARLAVMFGNKVIERMQSIDLNSLSAADVARWFDLSVRIERLSRGASTENVAADVHVQSEHPTDALETDALAERMERWARLLRERGESE